MDDQKRNMYGLEIEQPVRTKLSAFGIGPEDVTHLIFSHLHTDHAGGSTAFNPDRSEVLPCFPHAVTWVQGGEWRQAVSPLELSRVAYHIEDFLPLWSQNKVEFLQGNREILPGIRLEVTGGHTLFHQMVRIVDGDRELLYPGDLIPTSFHLPLSWRSAVDLYPVNTLEAKRRLLDEALQQKKLLVFPHEPAGGFWRASGSRENPVLERIEAE